MIAQLNIQHQNDRHIQELLRQASKARRASKQVNLRRPEFIKEQSKESSSSFISENPYSDVYQSPKNQLDLKLQSSVFSPSKNDNEESECFDDISEIEIDQQRYKINLRSEDKLYDEFRSINNQQDNNHIVKFTTTTDINSLNMYYSSQREKEVFEQEIVILFSKMRSCKISNYRGKKNGYMKKSRLIIQQLDSDILTKIPQQSSNQLLKVSNGPKSSFYKQNRPDNLRIDLKDVFSPSN